MAIGFHASPHTRDTCYIKPMPKGPKGEKRPADVIGNAVHVMRIATGEVEERPLNEGQRKGGQKGAASRARKLTSAQKAAIAKKAATSRWGKARVVRGKKEPV